MNITLKNVPDKVYRAVKKAAKEQGRRTGPMDDSTPMIRQERQRR
jgi:hypothetical protein